MKMANMDFVFDRMFTNPLDSQGVRFCGAQWTKASVAHRLPFVQCKCVSALWQ